MWCRAIRELGFLDGEAFDRYVRPDQMTKPG
jgi:hypothetical protein